MFVEERQRAKRVDAGVVRQTARDAQLLEWMSSMYGLPLDLVRQALGISEVRTYQLVQRWVKAGWVRRGKVDAGPTWIWPTKAVADQYLGWKAPEWAPRSTTAQHTRAAAAVRLHQAGLNLDRWVSERSLRHDQGWRQQGRKEPHTPDGIEILPDGRRVLIEVELTAKQRARYIDQPLSTSPDVHRGLLLEISVRANELGCDAVAYWCAPHVVRQVQEVVTEYEQRDEIPSERAGRGRKYWYVRNLEEVPGWTVQGS